MIAMQPILPKYRCHKIVGADKILAIDNEVLTLETFGALGLPQSFFDRHKPQVGGYYVVYDDEYASFSPAAAFEKGYTRLPE